MAHRERQTERLALRPLVPGDAAWITAGIASPDVIQWLTAAPWPYRRTDAEAFLKDVADDPDHHAIVSDGAPAGVISISPRHGDAANLGYWIKRDAWGQGLVTSAVTRIIARHWARCDTPISSGWLAGNAASAQILTQQGFAPRDRVLRWSQFHRRDLPLERVTLDAPFHPLFTRSTGRVRLNALTQEDVEAVHSFGVPEIARNLTSIPAGWSREDARAWVISRLLPRETGFGRAIRDADGRFLGSIGIGGRPWMLGYMLRPEIWGQGYATEALRAFLPAALAHGEIDTVEATVFEDNPASARVLAKFGFREIAREQGQGKARAAPAPMIRYRASRVQILACCAG